MAIERDCSTCARHQQAEPINPFCMSCLLAPELPRWHPVIDLEAYLVSLDERHEDEPEEMFFPPEPQSRKESLLEASLNTLSGFVVSYLVWMLVAAPLFNIPVNYTESFWITVLFTGVSLARSYVWRRLFVNKFFWSKADANDLHTLR